MTATLFVCSVCGTPVELSRHDADRLPDWERALGQPVVVHCIDCAVLFEPC